jgi:hypothetical protein
MAIEKVKICGVTFFKDKIDGKDIDSGAVFIEEHLNPLTGRSKGVATQKYPLGDAAKAQALYHLEYPFMAEVEFIRITNGNVSSNIVQSVKPISLASKTPSAA